MKSGWPVKPLGEVCEVVNGGPPKTGIAAYWGGSHQWITPAEMGKRRSPYVGETERTVTGAGLDTSSARILPQKSVILSSRAPIGHLVINTAAMATNQGCKGLVPRTGLFYKYLYYYLVSIREHLDAMGTGATFRELSGGRLKAVAIPLPPLAEQQRIVGLLDEAFAAIATAKASAEKNLQNTRAVFESFLHSTIASAFDSCAVVTMSEIATDITDRDLLPPQKSPTGLPFVTIGNNDKTTRQIDFSNMFMVPRSYYDALKPNRKPKRGDVLYTVTGSFGIPVVMADDQHFCFQRHIGLVRPNRETLTACLYYLLLSPQLFRQADDGATGTAQRTVSLRVLLAFPVPKVPVERQRGAIKALDALELESDRLADIHTRKLDAVKKSLLQHAVTGQLTSTDSTDNVIDAAIIPKPTSKRSTSGCRHE